MNKKKKLASRLQAMAEQFKRGKGHLPPDPEQSNHMRAAFANVAIAAFLEANRGDREDALDFLLNGLMHLCDRDPILGEFNDRVERAFDHYKEETATDAEYARAWK